MAVPSHSQTHGSQPGHRFKPSRQKQYEEAKITFNKTLKGHYRYGKTGYNRVGALFLTWKDDDMQCKATEVDALHAFFRDEFHFETDYYEIPSQKWRTGLNKKLSDFIWEYDSPDCLVLIYYGGHAYTGEETGSFKLAGKFRPDGDGDPTYFWNDISNCLRLPACDQLVIADCCYAAKAFGPEHVGKGKFELFASAGHNQLSPSPGMGVTTFTKAFHKVLVELLGKNPGGFPTSQLYREVYHKWTWENKPFHFDQSRYSHDKIWLRPQKQPKEEPKEGKIAGQGTGKSSLYLKLRLNGEPGNVMMNQLAMGLQYLPHVDEISIEELSAPKHQIEDFMLRIYQAKKLRPLVRKLYAQRQRKKFISLASSPEEFERHSKYVNLFLDQKTHSTYDWSSAKTDKKLDPSFVGRNRRKTSTWPFYRGAQHSGTTSLSYPLFSIDGKLSVLGYGPQASRFFLNRAKTFHLGNLSSSTGLPFALSPGLAQQLQIRQWENPEEIWHLLMWFAMMYVYGSMCFNMNE